MTHKLILVIDDNDDCIALIKSVLEYESDWHIVIAYNAREGIALAQSKLPDLILLDIIMPDLDGLDVYELLIKLDITTCLIPIIFMTAIDPFETKLMPIPKNAKVITKPLNIDQLPYQLSEVLENYNYL